MRTDNERGVLCLDGHYVESLDQLKNIISKGPFDIGTIKTNELLAAFRDGAAQEWLSSGSEEEIALAENFSCEAMRHDKINDTELLSLIEKSFGKESKHKLNVSLKLLSSVFVSPSGKKQDVTNNTIVCHESGKVKFQVFIKSDRAVNGAADISLNCPQQSLVLHKEVLLNTADKESVPIEYEFDYDTSTDYPIEFLYNDITLFKCSLTSIIIENGFEAIDLGLSVKWAKVNIGSKQPDDPGSFFALGENKTKEQFSSSNFSGTNLDAATSWGGHWRMPTKKEFQELIDKCTWTWKTINKSGGYEIEGPNHKKIFLCAAGSKKEEQLIGYNECGQYWINPQDGTGNSAERLIFINVKGIGTRIKPSEDKYYGLSIRPVLP